ncbi:hypothetical protein Amir_5582 [Actinosynnema mirum DSM 43827]|uniref:Uncharacterized protein n=1 Tax=Actinosynnema mirum (strain ATCC 29888 / DSM 43827 / JCM 3225 / NBRC 14064 / NCIMB 13271 / NRRL B-12336 / IMRU 3971 / 101) TaxID=446462 RepID=C6WBA9_ACTMD|nr:hypothetical protein Amir_5582 [Actinosynnema mirum DSM 43827]
MDHDHPAPPALDISPGDHPPTLGEIRDTAEALAVEYRDALLAEAEAGATGSRLVGVLLAMLREAHCDCGPPDTGHRAPVIPLPPRN